jgi:NADH:ubiquinone oxidoreductase subunit 4 (subunit M)
MILAGTFMSDMLGRNGPLAATIAATGLILAPIYVRLPDLTMRERVVFAPLLILIFYIGLFPNHMREPMAPAVDQFAASCARASETRISVVCWKTASRLSL